MSEENRPPDEAREKDEARRPEEEQPPQEEPTEATGERTSETGEGEKGLVDKAIDKAREKGLVDKANQVLEKAKTRLTGGR